MGDTADSAFDRMDREDEYDDIIDDDSYFGVRRGKIVVTCHLCGVKGLHWHFQKHRWRLWTNDDTEHVCDMMKLASEVFTSL